MAKQSTSKAKAKKAAAAVAETNPSSAKSVEWRGHTFKLSAELPKSLMFRMSQIQEADDPQPMLGLLQALLNADDESQFGVVIREIERAEDEEAVIEEAFALTSKILEQYGTTKGESGASQDS
jgi:hypothetical protein